MGKRLVRDRALEHWVVPGAELQVRPVRDVAEHQQLLTAKLLEEVAEVILARSGAELVKELADLLSVMQATARVNGVDWREVRTTQIERDAEAGGFVRGMVWETSR